MPDDEHLGGTRDPHEPGRRHRRDEQQPPEEKPKRRRRSMEGSGGVSVADLVQKHTGSRQNLTPVNPDSLVSGRRARQEDLPPGSPPQNRQNAAPPAGQRDQSIAAALDGGPGESAERPGGKSAYFTIPSDAVRNEIAPGGFPQDERATETPPPGDVFPPDTQAARRPRPQKARNSFPPDAFPEAEAPRARPAEAQAGPRTTFPDASRGHRGGPPSADGFPAEAEPPHRGGGRTAEPQFPPGTQEAPRTGRQQDQFPGDARTGFPPDTNAPRRRGAPSPFPPAPEAPGPQHGTGLSDAFRRPTDTTRRPGDTSGISGAFRRPDEPAADTPGRPLLPTDTPRGPAIPDAFRREKTPHPGPDPSAFHAIPGLDGPRRPGESTAYPPAPDDIRRPADLIHPGDPSALPGDPRRPPADGVRAPHPADLPPPGEARRPGAPDPRHTGPQRRPGETSAYLPLPGDPTAPGRPGDPGLPDGSRRPAEPGRHGDASAYPPLPGDPGLTDPRRPVDLGSPSGRRPVDAPAPHPLPGDPGLPDGPRRPAEPGRHGDASAYPPLPGDPGLPDGRRPGDAFHPGPADAGFAASTRRPGDPGLPDGPRRPGDPRRPGEPGLTDGPRRPGEVSAHLPVPPRHPNDPGRPGEAAAYPGDGPRHPNDQDNPRRPGETSAYHQLPGAPGRPGDDNGFPPEAGSRRGVAGRPAITPNDLGQGRFPADVPPPPPGQASGRFPLDGPDRRPLTGPADPLSDPRQNPVSLDGPDAQRRAGVPAVPLPPPRREDDDPISMTTEMEAIGEEVQKRRSIDHTLARFSAVHDEIKAEEREKKAKRRKLRPWQNDDEMDRLDELDAQQSMAMVVPNLDQQDDEDEDDEGKPRKKKRRWLKGKNAGKAFAIVVATLVFVSTAVAWGFKSYLESNSQDVAALDPDSDAIKDAHAQLGDENFLMVGSDTRAGATAEDGVGDEKSVEGARSDTVMIAHIPKNRERVVVVSFPRDLEVTRPACEGWDPTTGEYNGVQHPAEERVKLNTAYQVGGPMCVTKLVQELSGLAVNHFVGIDFHGFKDMVDAVQGVEVCVEEPMKDDVLGTIVDTAGTNVKLTGDQALNFVRARHVQNDGTSDYGRIIRQQRFLSSLLRKAMSSEVLLDPGKLTDFVKAFSKSTFGDGIGIDQLVTLGQSMQGVAAGRVTFITIPTVGESNRRGNEDLRVEDSDKLFDAIRRDAPLPGETPLPAPQDDASQQTSPQVQSGLRQQEPQGAPVDPKTIKIQVFNGGNDTDGIARDTADQLAEHGFEIVRVDSTPPVDTTVVRYAKGNEARAQTVQAAVPGATLLEDPSMGTAIMLVIGPEFSGDVVSPNGGGPPPEVPDGLSTVNANDVSCA